MKMEKKKLSRSLLIIGILVAFLAAYYIYVYFSTTPEEEAYAAAVQQMVENFDEARIKKNQNKEEEASSTKSYVEKMAKEEEAEKQLSFDKYRKEYVSEEEGGYLVEMPVKEILGEKVVEEYTYKIHVQEKDGVYKVVSMEKTD